MTKKNRFQCFLLTFLFLVACSHETKTNFNSQDCSLTSDARLNKEKLCHILKTILESSENIHSVLLERHGKIYFEFYKSGLDSTLTRKYGLFSSFQDFNAQTLHDQRSISKSIVSLLFGISVYRNNINLDDPFLKYYPELKNLNSEGREKIKIRDVLTMSAGLDWNEMGRSSLTSDETPLVWKSKPVEYFFDRDMIEPHGQKFNYSGGATMALTDLLTKIEKRSLLQIVKTDLFDPLEITEWEWTTNRHDIPLAAAGLRLKPHDMLKIGRLINQNGLWNGRQIVPAAWIKDSISPHIVTGINFMQVQNEEVYYGYQWWTGSISWKNKPLQWSAAIGNGGQRIYVIPELDLTLVITAGDYGSAEIQKKVSRLLNEVLSLL